MMNPIDNLNFLDTFLNYEDLYADNRYYHTLKATRVKNFIEENKSSEKSFLDAGAGRGPYTKIAQNKYGKIYCFEYDQNELTKAVQNLENDPQITFKQVDITDIPLENNSIDVVVCSEVLEHIPDYNKAMSEIYRVTKLGGKVLFSMPNYHSMLYGLSRLKHRKIIKQLDETKNKDATWEQRRHYYFNYKNIENIATKAGFTIIERQGVHVLRIPSKLRKILMAHFPKLFKILLSFNNFLAQKMPSYGSFYFLTLQK